MKKNTIFLFYGLFIFSIFYFIIVPMLSQDTPNKRILFQIENLKTFDEGFTYQREDGTFFETDHTKRVDIEVGEKLILSKILYDTGVTDHYLAVRLRHHALRAFLDDKLIFVTGYDSDNVIVEKMTNNFWITFPLPDDLNGKKLTLEFVPTYIGLVGEIPRIRFGSLDSVIKEITNAKMLDFIIGCSVLFIGFMIIFIHMNMGSFAVENRTLLYLGYTTILLSMWLLSETNQLQLFIGNEVFISYLPYIALLLFPIALTLQMESSYKTHRPYLRYFCWIFIVNAIVCFALHITGIIPIFNTIQSMHLLSIIYFLYVTSSILYEIIKHDNQESKQIVIELSLLFVAGILEMINFYSMEAKPLGFYIRLGLILYLIISFFRTFREIRTGYEKSKEAQYFKELAFVDPLTGGKNRAVYERDLVRFTRHRKTDFSKWLILFDANFLKVLNDNKGHIEGDRYLQYIHKCIVELFHEYGDSYRIGGDEFACILANMTDELIARKVKELQAKVQLFTDEFPLSIAVGFAEYDVSKFESMAIFIKYVDDSMYENKKIMKASASGGCSKV